MAKQVEQDIEFVPSDELDEPELAGAEDDAVRAREAEEPRGLMTAEDEEFEAAELAPDLADEIRVEADEAAEAEEGEVEEDHEEDLDEILRRHYGIVSQEPDAGAAAQLAGAEFACRSCFLRKPVSQLVDRERGICVDCEANGR